MEPALLREILRQRQISPHVDREFELAFLKFRGSAFQEFFSTVMDKAYPNDFRRIRSHGNTGDLKADGYLESQRTVFQVYGPDDIRSVRKLLSKMEDDFSGATANWAGRLRKWVFVHNSRTGLPAQAIQRLDAFRERVPGVLVESWGYEELRQIAISLKDEELQALWPRLRSSVAAPGMLSLNPQVVDQYWSWLRIHLRDSLRNSRQLNQADLSLSLTPMEEAIKATAGERKNSPLDSSRPQSAEGKSNGFGKRTTVQQLYRVIREQRRVLVVGDAGSGKTTLVYRFALREIERLIKTSGHKRRRHTPVLVELLTFAPQRPISELLLASITRSGAQLTRDEMVWLAERGYLLLIFDGLDEVATEYRQECIAQLLMIASRYGRCPVLLTSRPFPRPPRLFFQMAMAPLLEGDVSGALAAEFGSKREFQQRFGVEPRQYVRALPSELRYLCEFPMTLGMVVGLLKNGVELSTSLYSTYERFMLLLLHWDDGKERLCSRAAAVRALEELAVLTFASPSSTASVLHWTEATARALSELKEQNAIGEIDAERVTKALLLTGLVSDTCGEATFTHKTFQEFLLARILVHSLRPPHDHPWCLETGVALFLCSVLDNIEPMLEKHLERYDDVASLLPLLHECSNRGVQGGRFESLYRAIVLGEELSVELTHGMTGPEAEIFIEQINELVAACLAFRPKALSVLKNAASGILTAVQWEQSGEWFDCIVSALAQYRWPGTTFHKQLAKLYFTRNNVFNCSRCEYDASDLFKYLSALDTDDFAAAEQHLRRIRHLNSGCRRRHKTR